MTPTPEMAKQSELIAQIDKLIENMRKQVETLTQLHEGDGMKCGAVPSQGLEYGWEAEVHFYAKDHGIKLASKEDYQMVRELIATLKNIEKLKAKQDDIVRALMVSRKQRDEYKLKLGWKPIGGG